MLRRYGQRIIIVTVVICVFLICMSSCGTAEEIKYYSQKENYVTATGMITGVSYNEDATVLYIEFAELSPEFDDSCFKIVGENLHIVQKNGIDDKLKIGERVEFITAPRYFGDGYVMPVVAISVDEEYLLCFEDGYVNLLDWLNKT